MKNLSVINRILLGLLMFVPGLLKLLVVGPTGITGMLSGNFLFSWAPAFWAWILILGEIGSGVAILGNWKLKYTAIIPIIILTVAVLTSTIKWTALGSTGWSSVIMHIIAITGYVGLTCSEGRKSR